MHFHLQSGKKRETKVWLTLTEGEAIFLSKFSNTKPLWQVFFCQMAIDISIQNELFMAINKCSNSMHSFCFAYQILKESKKINFYSNQQFFSTSLTRKKKIYFWVGLSFNTKWRKNPTSFFPGKILIDTKDTFKYQLCILLRKINSGLKWDLKIWTSYSQPTQLCPFWCRES